MGRILDFTDYDAFEQFAASAIGSRSVMQRAYLAAVEASDRCNASIKESLQLRLQDETLELMGLVAMSGDPVAREQRARQADVDAIVEDKNADWQASIVVLFADDVLRRFSRRVLNKKPTLNNGYGPTYGGGVRLTTLLQAGANAIRHVSEWDDDEMLTFPYEAATIAKGSNADRARRNIRIFQRAFGKGVHEPIREMQSWAILCTMDGLYGTHGPDYTRVEAAVIAAARDIASESGPSAVTSLNDALEERFRKRSGTAAAS